MQVQCVAISLLFSTHLGVAIFEIPVSQTVSRYVNAASTFTVERDSGVWACWLLYQPFIRSEDSSSEARTRKGSLA